MIERMKEAMELATYLDASEFAPLGERVITLRDEGPSQIGGIEIPEAYKPKTYRAIVVATGPEVPSEGPGSILPGDVVLFSRYDAAVYALPNREGNEVNVEVLHYRDLYVRRRPDIVKTVLDEILKEERKRKTREARKRNKSKA